MQRFLDRLYFIVQRLLPKKAAQFLRSFFSVEFFIFVIIGIINTFSTAVISTCLDAALRFLPDGAALSAIHRLNLTFIAGYCASMLLSFFLNCRFTFRERPTISRLIRFPISYIPNFIIQYICVWFFSSVLALNSSVSYLIAAVIGVPVTFLTMRILVFGRK